LLDIGFTLEEVQDIYSILASVILIGDIVSSIAANNWEVWLDETPPTD
jgi:myosin heavy subunit